MNRVMHAVAAAVFVVALLPVAPRAQGNEETARLVEYYTAGIDAEKAKDCAAYEDNMRRALALAPSHPALLRHVARALACRGRDDDAVALLRRVVATGADLALGDDPYFEGLRGRDDFQQMLRDVSANQEPLGRAEVAFALDAGDLLPEGIAYDPHTDAFYLGSIRYGKILRVSRSGRWKDFASPEGMCGVLGLRVDVGRRHLWAVASHMPGVVGYSEDQDGSADVFRFDVDSGSLLARYPLSNVDARHNLNDIAVGDDGTAYITDSFTGAVYTIDPGRDALEVLLEPHTTSGPNGIALSRDGTLLYIAQYGIDIVVFDRERGTVEPLRTPDDVVVCGVDGLYVHRGTLIAVQNFLGMQQVSQFFLNDAGDAITGGRVLVRYDRHLDDPTTGALLGGDFYFVANSQLPKLGEDGTVPAPGVFDDTFILRTRIGHDRTGRKRGVRP